MTIHQLSVFVENKSGTLLQVLELLKEAHIQLIASTISDITKKTITPQSKFKDYFADVNYQSTLYLNAEKNTAKVFAGVSTLSVAGILSLFNKTFNNIHRKDLFDKTKDVMQKYI